MALMTGGSSTGVTVTLKLRFALKAPPSVTVKVRFIAPFALSTGVTVAVQFGATPPNRIPATGIMAAFEVEALIDVEQFNVSSTSEIVKLMVSGVSSAVV